MQLLKSRQRIFETGDKAGKLPAQQARAAAASRFISSIKLSSGATTTDPKLINETFSKFDSDLYASSHLNTSSASTIEFPKVDQELVGNLAKPVSTTEIMRAITTLQSGKSPGPDGFTVKFYKNFAPLISIVLCDMYNEALSLSRLPQTLTYNYSPPKGGQGPLTLYSFRPISLLNVDYKIRAKILTFRLRTVLLGIISTDQTGFMLGRHSFHNTLFSTSLWQKTRVSTVPFTFCHSH